VGRLWEPTRRWTSHVNEAERSRLQTTWSDSAGKFHSPAMPAPETPVHPAQPATFAVCPAAKHANFLTRALRVLRGCSFDGAQDRPARLLFRAGADAEQLQVTSASSPKRVGDNASGIFQPLRFRQTGRLKPRQRRTPRPPARPPRPPLPQDGDRHAGRGGVGRHQRRNGPQSPDLALCTPLPSLRYRSRATPSWTTQQLCCIL
jgi:hypothetical protein